MCLSTIRLQPPLITVGLSSVKCLGLHLYSWCHQKLPVASRRLLPSKLTLFPDKLAFLSFWFQWQFSAFRRPSWNAKLQILPAVLMTLSSTLLHSWPVCSRTEEMYPENNRKKGIRLPFRISLKNNNSLPSLLISGIGERARSYLYFVFCSWLFCYQLVVQIRKIQKRMNKRMSSEVRMFRSFDRCLASPCSNFLTEVIALNLNLKFKQETACMDLVLTSWFSKFLTFTK